MASRIGCLADTHTASHSPLDPHPPWKLPSGLLPESLPRLMPSHRQMISGHLFGNGLPVGREALDSVCIQKRRRFLRKVPAQFVGTGQPRGFDSDQTEKSRAGYAMEKS